MKYLLLILLFFVPCEVNTYSEKPDIRLVHVNAKWNKGNDINIESVNGVRIEFTLLEVQSDDFKKKIKRVPILILYDKGDAVYNWQADLSFKLDVTEDDIKNVMKKLLDERYK